MVRNGLQVLGVHRMVLEVYAFNPRARHVHEKVGLSLEGSGCPRHRLWPCQGKWMLLVRPFPSSADYLLPESVSPLRQVILDNISGPYWGISWAAAIAILAGSIILGLVFRNLLVVHRAIWHDLGQ